LKNNPILIILLGFLAITSYFWLQVFRIKELPVPQSNKTNAVISGKEAEAFIKLADTLLIDYKGPLPEVYGRDPFYKDYMVVIPEAPPKIEKAPAEVFILTSVVYNKNNPLAVINGKILSEGDTITNNELESRFIIENIGYQEVRINDGNKKYVLRAMKSN
jgi:hypothetical protein